jgi:hypothetical protein
MMRAVVACVACAFTAAPAFAQNLVTNGEFHTDVSSWSAGPGATIEWNPLDWAANPASGSIRVTNVSLATGAAGAFQCIPFHPAVPFEMGARVRIPLPQATIGTAFVTVFSFANPTCSPPAIGGANTGSVSTQTPEVWVNLFTTGLNPPPGTQSVGVRLFVAKEQVKGALSALFDRVVFGPAGTTPVELQSFAVE